MRPDRDSAGDTLDVALARAYRAIEDGRPQEAREIAQSALIAAKAGADQFSEARALACLAHCDYLGSRLRRASDTSRRAALLFERLGYAVGEAAALTTLAQVSMLLGRNDEAVEAALLCVRLCDLGAPNAQAVLAHNCLGIAYGWSGNFERADASLEMSIWVARHCSPNVSCYQPKLNQCLVEAARLADERYRTGSMTTLEKLAQLLAECKRLEVAGNGVTILPGLKPVSHTVSLVLTSMLAAWRGDTRTALTMSERSMRSLSGTVTWLDAVVCWGAAERARAEKDWVAVEAALVEMKELALSVEHEQLVSLAQLQIAEVFELQGKIDAALCAHRLLRVRERRMVAESLRAREAAVSLKLDARQSERHLHQAVEESKQFERLSLQDPLTGIANRRRFEQLFAEEIQDFDATKPFAVAMIDVDRFKLINDTYSHVVGDRVLKTIAALTLALVREQDLLARWAGDEFVILFSDSSEGIAEKVCQRVRAAIATFEWNSVATGLQVSVSIGLSQARTGDTAESLLLRSDESMYETKPTRLAPE